MKYFTIENNQQQGPFTIYELRDRNLSSDTLVWAEGMAEWTPAWQVKELHDFLYGQNANGATPPPIPPTAAAAPTPQPQPQPAPAAPAEPQQEKHRPWLKMLSTIFVLVLIIAGLGLTNPERYDHRTAVQRMVVSNSQKNLSTGSRIFDMALKLMLGTNSGDELLTATLNGMLRYHNYVLFSTTTFHDGDHDVQASFGILGHVFTKHEDQLLQKIGSGPELGNSASDSANDETTQPDSESGSQDEALPMDGENVDETIDQVSKIVKQQVQANSDSVSSEEANKVIDQIVDFVKGQTK